MEHCEKLDNVLKFLYEKKKFVSHTDLAKANVLPSDETECLTLIETITSKELVDRMASHDPKNTTGHVLYQINAKGIAFYETTSFTKEFEILLANENPENERGKSKPWSPVQPAPTPAPVPAPPAPILTAPPPPTKVVVPPPAAQPTPQPVIITEPASNMKLIIGIIIGLVVGLLIGYLAF